MLKKIFNIIFAAIPCFFISTVANAMPITVSTGDLGNNVIRNASSFQVFLPANTPLNNLASSIDITYGLWNSPEVLVSVFFNSNFLGNFLADEGYIDPGPEFTSFDVTGLLLNGLNTTSFDGLSANDGDYVIGKVALNYHTAESIAEPSSLALAVIGLAGFRLVARCRKA
jgi:hypothetical protein